MPFGYFLDSERKFVDNFCRLAPLEVEEGDGFADEVDVLLLEGEKGDVLARVSRGEALERVGRGQFVVIRRLGSGIQNL